MNIKETFLSLTKKTYPYGSEYRLKHLLPKGILKDNSGNYYYKIGNSRTIFASHLDTANKIYGPVKHIFENNMIKTDGQSILGADDKAGVTILLYMISQNVPGTYYFFIGEEVGCIGSKAAVKLDDFSNYDRIISFDRKDTCSIITHQSYTRCCSGVFAEELSKQYIELGLNLIPDDTGVHTDSAEFIDIIPECTNISVGYYKEHTHEESQDIDFLEKLCKASVNIKWELLPIVRDNKIKEYKEYDYADWWFSKQEERNRDTINKFNNKYKNKNRKKFTNYDYDLAYAYGYDEIDDDTPFDVAVNLDYEDIYFNSDIDTYVKSASKRDVYLTYRDFLNDGKLTLDEYNIIHEQLLCLNF